MAPTVSISSNLSTLKATETATITFSFSEDPGSSFYWDGTSGDLAVSGGTLSSLSGSGLTRTATFTPTANNNAGTASISVTAGSYSDSAGNSGAAGTTPALTFDTLAPSLTSTISLSNSALTIGDTANVTVSFSEAVTAFDLNDITSDNGLLSNLSTADNGHTWTATFTPTANTTDASNLIGLNLTTITDLAGNAGSGSADSGNYTIDTQRPSLSNPSGLTTTTANGSYAVGSTITILVPFLEVVTVNTSSGTPTLLLETGATDRTATYSSGSGTNTLAFSYTVQTGDTSADLDYTSTIALDPNGGTIQDAAGNDAILSLSTPGEAGSLGANAALVIDTSNSQDGLDNDGALDSYESNKDANSDGTYDNYQANVATFITSDGTSSIAIRDQIIAEETDPDTGGTVSANTLLYFDNATTDPQASSGLQLRVDSSDSSVHVSAVSDLLSFTINPTVTTVGSVNSSIIADITTSAIDAFKANIQEVDLYLPEHEVTGGQEVYFNWNSLYKTKANNNAIEYYLFNYNPLTGLGGILLDRDGNGKIDGAKLYLKDGELGDFDETVNGQIVDPIGFSTLDSAPVLHITADQGLAVDGVDGTGLWLSLDVTGFNSLTQGNLELYNASTGDSYGAIGATLGSGPTSEQSIYLASGNTLNFRYSNGAGQTTNNPAISISSTATGFSLGLDADLNGIYTDLMLDISSSIAASSPASLAMARKQLTSSDAILDLTNISASGIHLTLDISTDCGLHNRFGFVKIDPLTGTTYYQVAGPERWRCLPQRHVEPVDQPL